MAQDAGTIFLQGITVTSANRTPTDASKVGSSVEVLTEEDLEKESKTYLKDYLEQLPGVNFTQNGPPGSPATISVRGAYQRYVKVLVDGIDVSDPTGTTTEALFQHLLVGDISRIEVLKGSQSTLYGGDAVGGVITIDTKKATKPGFFQEGNAEYGAFDSFRGAYTAGYADTSGSNISFTVQGIDTAGFSAAAIGTEDDGYENLTLSSRGEYRVSESVSLFFAARSINARYEYDDSYLPPDFVLNDSLAHGRIEQHAGRVGAQVDLFGGAFQNTFAIQGMKSLRDETASFPGWFDGDRVKGEYKGLLHFNDKLSLLAGAEWERAGATTLSLSGRETADILGTYAQLSMEPFNGLVLTAGGRIDDHSTFGQFNTHRLTAAYLVPGTGTKFRASAGTGYRAPSLYELYASGSGNPDLTPEESESWDAGVEQSLYDDRLRLSATYFELDTDNMISFIPTPPWQSINVPGVTHRKGVELTAAAVISPGLSVSAGYTYIDSDAPPNGEQLVRVPKHNLVLALDAKPIEKVSLNVTAKFVSDLVDAPQDAPVALDDYVLVSAKLGYEFEPGWTAYIRGENLLDEEYQTTLGYGTAGLSVFGGITMALPSD